MLENFINSIGKDVTGSTTLDEALVRGDLNWKAKSAPVNYQGDSEDYLEASSYKVVYKDSDKSALGVVGINYGIIQNTEAFAIAEALIGGNVKFKRAGQVLGQTFIVMEGEKALILGEEVENYIIIRNSFDGSCRLQISWVPIINNSLVDTNKPRVFAIKHSSEWIKKYGKTFVETLVSDGLLALESYIKSMMAINYSPVQLTKVLDQVLPLKYDKNGSPRDKANENVLNKRKYFSDLLGSQDLAQYSGTAYSIYKALSQLETHSFQSAKVIKPERNSYKKVKRLFTNSGISGEAISYLEKMIGV